MGIKKKNKNQTSLSKKVIGIIVVSLAFFGIAIGFAGFLIYNYSVRLTKLDAILYYVVSIIIASLIVGIIVSILSIKYIKKQLVKPVEEISNEAARFSGEHTLSNPLGNISEIKELTTLSNSIDSLEIEMTKYIEEIQVTTAEKERIGVELSLASKIQESQIPTVFPQRNDFDIYGSMTPARMIGGDFYNFMQIDDDHLAMWIGDVSGKGVPAALFMMNTNLILTERIRYGGVPSEILSFANDRICENNPAEMFVTVWLGILELSTGKITCANAGHTYPALKEKDKFEILEDKHGMVLGGLNGMKYKDYELKMNVGSKLFVYSDGVPEAKNEVGEMFREDRMLTSLNKAKDGNAETIINSIKEDVNAFVGGAVQFDDLTMLCVEYKGKK